MGRVTAPEGPLSPSEQWDTDTRGMGRGGDYVRREKNDTKTLRIESDHKSVGIEVEKWRKLWKKWDKQMCSPRAAPSLGSGVGFWAGAKVGWQLRRACGMHSPCLRQSQKHQRIYPGEGHFIQALAQQLNKTHSWLSSVGFGPHSSKHKPTPPKEHPRGTQRGVRWDGTGHLR